MKGTTHLAAGVATSLLLADSGVGAAVGIIVGAVLPDIDSPESLVGRHIPVIPRLIPHRTLTHSLLLVLAGYVVSPYLALGLGIHLLLDMMNPKGVPLLWPMGMRFRIPIIHKIAKEGGAADWGLCGCLTILNVLLVIQLLA